jgi:hypothetical protein
VPVAGLIPILDRHQLAMAVDANAVYVNGSQGVVRIPKSGAAVTTVTSPTTSFTIDATNIYWAGQDTIMTRSLPGGPERALANFGVSGSWPLVTDLVVAGSRVFWIQGGQLIQTVSTSGGTPIPVTQATPISGRIVRYHWLASDGTFLYWASDEEIQRRPLSGGSITTVIKPQRPWFMSDFALDGAQVYVAHGSDASACSTSGGGCGALLQTSAIEWLDRVLVDNGKVYWADRQHGEVNSVPTSGGPIQHFTTTGAPAAVAVDWM